MAYEILEETSGDHRDTTYYNLVWFGNTTNHIIDGMQAVVVCLESDHKWWIIPNSSKHESEFEDLGPYDTVEEAIVYLRLHSECRQSPVV